jgi:hypothetical protein
MIPHPIQRVVLGALLLMAILLAAMRATWHPVPAAPDALGAFLKHQGLQNVKGSSWAPGQYFEASLAGCPGKGIHVFAVSSLMEDQNFVESRLPSKSVRTFFFLNKSWPTTLDRMEIWTMYAEAQARNIVRSHPLNYLDNIIEVVSPSRCDALESIDWPGFWDSSPS